MILAEQLLSVLEEKHLLPGELVQSLRKQLSQSEGKVAAATLAKRLVDKGHISAQQAKQVLESLATPSKAAGAKPVHAESELTPLETEDLFGPAPGAKPAAGALHPSSGAKKPGSPQPAVKPGIAGTGAGEAHRAPPSDEEDVYGLADTPVAPGAKPTVGSPGAGGGPAPAKPAASAGLGADALLAAAAMDSAAGPKTPLRPQARPKIAAGKKPAGKARSAKASRSTFRQLALLAGLLVAGAVIGVVVWQANRSDGTEELKAADADFRSASYAAALDKYADFLKYFPRHVEAGRVRVNHGICQLRQATAGEPRWPAALAVAQEVLAEITTQVEFPQSQEQLATMLPAIAQGLAAALRAKPDPKTLQQAGQAWDFVRHYVPKSRRDPVQAAQIETILAFAERELSQTGDLEKGVTAIRQAVADGKTSDAYAARAALVASRPELAGHASLRKAMDAVAQAEKKAVRWVAKPVQAVAKEPDAAVIASTALYSIPQPGKAEGVGGQVVAAAAQGAVFALDASSGQLLWRRYVGFAPVAGGGELVPLVLPSEGGADWIFIDWTGPAVLRVEARSGKLRWLHPLDERPCRPAMAGDRLVVPTASGRLHVLEAASGHSKGFVELPQPLAVGPAIDGKLIFQPADQENLYVVTLEGQCKQIVSLGHERGSIWAPPAVAGQALLVAVNDGLEHASVQVLAIGRDEKVPLRATQQLEMAGRVDHIAAFEALAVVTSDRGQARVLDLSDTPSGKPPLTLVELPPSGPTGLVRYAYLGKKQWWLADVRLARYATLAKPPATPDVVCDAGSVFLQAPRLVGSTLFCVRRPDGLPGGVRVSAVDAASGKKLWETAVGSPLAASPLDDGQDKAISAVGVDASVWSVKAGAGEGALTAAASAAVPAGELSGPVTAAISPAAGHLAFADDSHLCLLSPGTKKAAIRRIDVGGQRSGPLVALDGGLLLPLATGQIMLLDAATGAKRAEAFQPKLAPGDVWQWQVSPPAGKQVLVHGSYWSRSLHATKPASDGSDAMRASRPTGPVGGAAAGRSRLYLVGLKTEPRPHLAAVAQMDLESPLVSRLAVVGQIGYAVEASGKLRAFPLPTLTQGKGWPLGGRCAWGPATVGQRVFLAAGGKLLCLDGQQNMVWQVDLPHGPLAGAPAAVKDDYLFASASGVVWRAEGASGKPLAKRETGRPLASGPLVIGNRVVLSGHDGTLYEVEQP